MHRGLSSFISYVFHPLILSTMLVIVLYLFTPALLQPINDANIRLILTAIFILTFLIPIFSIGMLKVTRSISSIKLENHKERVMPFFFIAVYYGLTTYLFAYKLQLSDIIIVIFGATSVVVFLVALISYKYKISAHAAGVWGVVGFLIAIHLKFPGGELLYPLVLSVLLGGVISSSRLALGSHKPAEVYAGAVLGLLVCFTSIFVFT